MSPELIAAIAAGLVAVISAIATAQSKRSQRQTEELTFLRARDRAQRQAIRDMDRWSGHVIRLLDRHGLTYPPHPLDQDGDHDQPLVLTDGYAPAPGGRRRRRADNYT